MLKRSKTEVFIMQKQQKLFLLIFFLIKNFTIIVLGMLITY